MIEIVFRDGEICRFRNDEYTEYEYDCSRFTVIRDSRCIESFRLSELRYVEVNNK